MPQCIEELEATTASHRLWLPAVWFIQAISAAALPRQDSDAGEPQPTEATVNTAINLVSDVPFSLLRNPVISPFYGEIHISWKNGPKQVVLMCFPAQQSLVHHYLRVPNAASEHDIEEASAERLAHWLRWLRA